ncbi:hypothetical protein IGI04_016832 [Brassica rapa subsp. trilocularis]|uniref:Patatin n=1 Tax=Brassica rapa subsp. trilocularis TaxID=1813537 RepID=A0ABQ7MU35_BRACM|nr:hypothetical protein IGI04_016832 [Brassica rapa subsp. trilocularis]
MGNQSVDGLRAKLTLKDTLKPVLIPCYDLTSSAPFLFSRADALETDGYDFKLWEVCRATWAEPGVFEPVEMRSVDGKTRCVAVDGGLAMSNPTAAAFTHVLHNKQEFPLVRGVEDLLVLSLVGGSDGAADNVDQAVSMAFSQCRRSNYVRIQADGSSFESNFEKLDWLAGELVLEHQRRSCRIAPTVAFKQTGDRRTDQKIFTDIDCMF